MQTKKGEGLLVIILNENKIILQTTDGYTVVEEDIKNVDLTIDNEQIVFGTGDEQYIVRSKYAQQIQQAFNIFNNKQNNQYPTDPLYKCYVTIDQNINGVIMFDKNYINLNNKAIKFSQVIIYNNQENVINLVYKLDRHSNATNTVKIQFEDNDILIMFLYYCKNRQEYINDKQQQTQAGAQTYKTIENNVSPQLNDDKSQTLNTLDQYHQKQENKQKQVQENMKQLEQQQQDQSPMIQLVQDQRYLQQSDLNQALNYQIVNELNAQQTNLQQIQTQNYKSLKDQPNNQLQKVFVPIQFKAVNLITGKEETITILKQNEMLDLAITRKQWCKTQARKCNDIVQINLYEYPNNAQGLFAISKLYTIFQGIKAYDIKRNQLRCAKLSCIDNFRIPSAAQINNQYIKQYQQLQKDVISINKNLKKAQYYIVEFLTKQRHLEVYGIKQVNQYKQLEAQLE